jgi:hypothetical protein
VGEWSHGGVGDPKSLVFERRYRQEVVIVAVNRGEDTTIAIQERFGLAPGHYTGLLTQASEVNQGNFLTVPAEGQATMHLGRLSSLVVWSQPPQPYADDEMLLGGRSSWPDVLNGPIIRGKGIDHEAFACSVSAASSRNLGSARAHRDHRGMRLYKGAAPECLQ